MRAGLKLADVFLFVWTGALILVFYSIFAGSYHHRPIDPYAGKTPEQICDAAQQILDSPSSSPGDRIYLINRLGRIKTDRATEILRQAALHQPPPVNKIAAADLFGRDDITALAVLKDDLQIGAHFESGLAKTSTATPADGFTRVAGVSISANLGSYLSRVRNPRAVPVLLLLLKSTDPQTREGAAGALVMIFSWKHEQSDDSNQMSPLAIDVPAVTSALIVGLDDSDEMVRYMSVCTLMEINRDPHYPSVDLFEGHEADYVNGWKAWAKQQAQPKP